MDMNSIAAIECCGGSVRSSTPYAVASWSEDGRGAPAFPIRNGGGPRRESRGNDAADDDEEVDDEDEVAEDVVEDDAAADPLMLLLTTGKFAPSDSMPMYGKYSEASRPLEFRSAAADRAIAAATSAGSVTAESGPAALERRAPLAFEEAAIPVLLREAAIECPGANEDLAAVAAAAAGLLAGGEAIGFCLEPSVPLVLLLCVGV